MKKVCGKVQNQLREQLIMIKTLTVGIAAYNEEANIKQLVQSLMNQHVYNGVVKKIIIASDASTDQTVNEVKALNDERIELIDGRSRIGVGKRLNQIISMTNSDILVTLDADIKITDLEFLAEIIRPILENQADLTSVPLKPILPKTSFGKTLYFSMGLKNALFDKFKNGNNIYTCHGPVRAYSKKLYKALKFPTAIGNDMYSYLKCLANNMEYQYVQTTEVWYALPETEYDHQLQSARFHDSKNEMKKYFSPDLSISEFQIPTLDYLCITMKFLPQLLKQPLLFIKYLLIYSQILFASNSRRPDLQLWPVVKSSKKLKI